MKQYLELCTKILTHGEERINRTSVKAITIFGSQIKYNLANGFPLVTTKFINIKAVIYELLWFIKGDTNIKYLVDNNVNIWNEWPFAKFQQHADYQQETIEAFALKIKQDISFANQHGNLGPVYGKQWRNFAGVDQLANLITNLQSHPFSRRHILTSWNPAELDVALLPPCHILVQFFISQDKKLFCQLYQRSADMFLGVPFNIASYSLLTMMIAQVCNLTVGEFIHTIGDNHIYLNHLDAMHLQISRHPYPLPQMMLDPTIKVIDDFQFHHFTLKNYVYHPRIAGKVAV